MDNNTYNLEIDLKYLVIAILRRWRPIIIFAFILAILFGGYKCGNELMRQGDERYVSDLKEQYEGDLKKYEQLKRGYERDIQNYASSITNQERYNENSILLKTDPYNQGMATVDVFVKMSELPLENSITVTTLDSADGVLKAYASSIKQGKSLIEMSKQKGIDLIYLKELINVEIDYTSNMFNVTVTSEDEKGAEEILNGIIDDMESMKPEIEDKLGRHSFVMLNRNSGVVTNQFLADLQQQRLVDLTDTNKNLDRVENELKRLVEPNMPVVLSNVAILKSGLKYATLGGFLGAFLTIICVCIISIVNERLSSDSEIRNRFGLRFLGSFSQKKDTRFLSCIDAWLDRLEGRETIPDEITYEVIAANVYNLINKDKSLFLTGTVGEEALKNLVIKLQERFPEIKFGFGVDITKNVAALQNTSGYNSIILVEARGEARYSDIEKEIRMILAMNKDILGYIYCA